MFFENNSVGAYSNRSGLLATSGQLRFPQLIITNRWNMQRVNEHNHRNSFRHCVPIWCKGGAGQPESSRYRKTVDSLFLSFFLSFLSRFDLLDVRDWTASSWNGWSRSLVQSRLDEYETYQTTDSTIVIQNGKEGETANFSDIDGSFVLNERKSTGQFLFHWYQCTNIRWTKTKKGYGKMYKTPPKKRKKNSNQTIGRRVVYIPHPEIPKGGNCTEPKLRYTATVI